MDITLNTENNLLNSWDIGPNYPQLQQDFDDFLAALRDLRANLQAYLENPSGPNADQELSAIEHDQSVLLTLVTPGSSQNFFSASQGDPAVLQIASLFEGMVSSMNTLLSSGDFEGVLQLASSQEMNSALTALFNILYHT